MRYRTKLAAAAAAAAAVLGGGTAYAVTAAGPAAQITDHDVFACVNQAGGIDYMEFRLPLPHPCWFASEQLWRWSVDDEPSPGATPTITATGG